VQGLKLLKIHNWHTTLRAMILGLIIAMGYFTSCQPSACSQVPPGSESDVHAEGPVKYLVCKSNQIAAALATGKADLWMYPGMSMQSFPPDTQSYNTALTIAVHDEGNMLAVGGDSGKLALWPDLGSHQAPVTTKMPNSFPVTALAFGHYENKDLLAAGSNNDLLLFDCAGRDLPMPPIKKINGLILRLNFSPDGTRLALAVASGTGAKTQHLIYLFHVDTISHALTLEATLSGHKDQIFWLAFSPDKDGTKLASADEGGVTLVWGLSKKKEGIAKQPEGRYVRQEKKASAATSAIFANKNGSLIVGYNDGKIAVFAIGKAFPKQWFSGHTARVSALGMLAEETQDERLVSGSYDKTVRIWKMSDLGKEPVGSSGNPNVDPKKPPAVTPPTVPTKKFLADGIYVDDTPRLPGAPLPERKTHNIKFVVDGKVVEGTWTPLPAAPSVSPTAPGAPKEVGGTYHSGAHPAWSANSKELVFEANEGMGQPLGIYKMTAGDKTQRMSTGHEQAFSPAYGSEDTLLFAATTGAANSKGLSLDRYLDKDSIWSFPATAIYKLQPKQPDKTSGKPKPSKQTPPKPSVQMEAKQIWPLPSAPSTPPKGKTAQPATGSATTPAEVKPGGAYNAEISVSRDLLNMLCTSINPESGCAEIYLHALNSPTYKLLSLPEREGKKALYAGEARFSPDGSQIVCQAFYPHRGEEAASAQFRDQHTLQPHHMSIWIMNSDGTNAHPLIGEDSKRGDPSALNVLPSFTPDGKSVVYTTLSEGNGERRFRLTQVPVIGEGAADPLGLTPDFDITQLFSPDNQKKLIVRTSNREGRLFIVPMPEK